MAPVNGRLAAIMQLLPNITPIIDVGADHGQNAYKIGALPTERQVHRIAGNKDLSWTVCDGLTSFRAIGAAVITGMGAHKIINILTNGPTMTSAVLHAADKPSELRKLLAKSGWKILNERIAQRPGGFDEVILAGPGKETTSGFTLHYGPHLLQHRTKIMQSHMEQEKKRLSKILHSIPNGLNTHRSVLHQRNFVTDWLDATTTPTLH